MDSTTGGQRWRPIAQRFGARVARFVAGCGTGYAPAQMTAIDPIVVSVVLAAPPERAFTAFADHFGQWWPVATHSLSRHAATRCRLDLNLGGTLEEHAPDGARHRWGTVEAIEPDRRLRFTWHPGREAHTAQWVDIEFMPLGAGTRVTLTHGGWEALGEIAPILRREYVSGWQDVLGKSTPTSSTGEPGLARVGRGGDALASSD